MRPITQFEKDPDSTLDYSVDWSEVFPDDPITAASADVPEGLVLENETSTDTSHVFRLSGGTAGQRYLVTSRVDTTSGQHDERTVEVVVVQR